MGITLPENQIKYLQAQNQALEMQLADRSEMAANVSARYELMKESLRELSDKYAKEKQAGMDITQDMTRQYKGMQDDLLKKINARERTIQDLRDAIEVQRREFDRSLKSKDDEIEFKNSQIERMRQEMETLGTNFAQMLAKSLAHLKERVEMQAANYNEHAIPIQQRMEEFNFKSCLL